MLLTVQDKPTKNRKYYCFFVFIWFLFFSTTVFGETETEIFWVKPLPNNLKYLEKLEGNHFFLKQKDTLSIKAFIEPKKITKKIVINQYKIPLENIKCSKDIFIKRENKSIKLFTLKTGKYCYLSLDFKNKEINLMDYPFFSLVFWSQKNEPNIKTSFTLTTSEKEENKLINLQGIYPQNCASLVPIFEDIPENWGFKAKSFSYLAKRELGLSDSPHWRYAEDKGFIVVQKRLNWKLPVNPILRLYLSSEVHLERVNLFLDLDGNGRKDKLILWEEIPHKIISKNPQIIEINLQPILKKISFQQGKSKLYEVIIFLKGTGDKLTIAKKIKKLVLFKLGDISTDQIVPVKKIQNGNFRKIIFDLYSFVKKENLFSAKLQSIKIKIELPKETVCELQSITLEDEIEYDTPIFLENSQTFVYKYLGNIIPPNHFVKKFLLLWQKEYPLLNHYKNISDKTYRGKKISIIPIHGKYNVFFNKNRFIFKGKLYPKTSLKEERSWSLLLKLPNKEIEKLEIEEVYFSNEKVKWWLIIPIDENHEIIYPLQKWYKNRKIILPGKLLKNKREISITCYPNSSYPAEWELSFERILLYRSNKGFSPIIENWWEDELVNISYPLSNDPYLGIWRLKSEKKLFDLEIPKNNKGNFYISAKYNGKAKIFINLKNENMNTFKIFLPSTGKAIRIPKNILNHIEIWAEPLWSDNSTFEYKKGNILNIQQIHLFFLELLPYTIDYIQNIDINELKWFDDEWIYKKEEDKLLPITEPICIDNTSNFYSFKKLFFKYKFLEESPGYLEIFNESQKALFSKLLKDQGSISIDLFRLNPNTKNFCIYFNNNTSKYVVIKDFSLIGQKHISPLDLFRKDISQLFSIDRHKLISDPLEKENFANLSQGIWYDFGEIDLDIGDHKITIKEGEFFKIKAIVLESKNIYHIQLQKLNQINSSWKGKIWSFSFKIIIFSILFIICLFYFRSSKFKIYLNSVKKIYFKIKNFYCYFPNIFWFFIWSIIAVSLYEKGLSLKVNTTENYYWDFGRIFMTISYHHFITSCKVFFDNYFPKLSKYIYNTSGTPYIFGFIVLILICALFLVLNLEFIANELSIIAYYLLVVGVFKELIYFLKNRNSHSKIAS